MLCRVKFLVQKWGQFYRIALHTHCFRSSESGALTWSVSGVARKCLCFVHYGRIYNTYTEIPQFLECSSWALLVAYNHVSTAPSGEGIFPHWKSPKPVPVWPFSPPLSQANSSLTCSKTSNRWNHSTQSLVSYFSLSMKDLRFATVVACNYISSTLYWIVFHMQAIYSPTRGHPDCFQLLPRPVGPPRAFTYVFWCGHVLSFLLHKYLAVSVKFMFNFLRNSCRFCRVAAPCCSYRESSECHIPTHGAVVMRHQCFLLF